MDTLFYFLCMYIGICIYVCVYVRMYMCICVYVSIFIQMHLHMYLYVCVYVYLYMYIYIYIYIFGCVCGGVRVCMCMCIYVCICTIISLFIQYLHLLSFYFLFHCFYCCFLFSFGLFRPNTIWCVLLLSVALTILCWFWKISCSGFTICT